ncbi:protein PF14_0175-like [Camponotus floridanus]|uniref:protein PF14_0175-like n=1 Tax=Camponotus floridanus TaxID=104421 RepID=UPI000DC6B4F1|nr:protein PF14_0175-like [Camponotus floridanus]
MILYYVILVVLSWPQIRCTEDANLESDEIFDQIATASENTIEAIKHSSTNSKNPQEQDSSISSSESATVHYENSNGFVPIVPSVSPSYNDPDSYDSSSEIDDSEQQENESEESNARNVVSAQDSSEMAKKFEEDLAYSSEARIFLNYPGSLTNRRSFDFQEGRTNEFELLKINNDTPAVANYQEFYENVRSTVNTETDSDPNTSSSESSNEGRGNKIRNYAHNYGQQSQQINDEDSYAQYSYDAQDTKKITHEQEKVTDNYRQQVAANYDGHGQNAATVSSSSRTNYQVNELAHSGTYDNVPQLSRTHYRFKPVVVTEANNHKTDMKFDNHLLNSAPDTTLESSSSEMSNRYQVYNDNRQRSYHRTEDSKNLSDESTDYSEYIERPRVQKTRRRPSYSDSSRKLPKEHRGTMNDSTEEDKQKYNSSKIRSHRYKVKANPWLNDPSINHDESVEDVKYGSRGSNTETKSSKAQNSSRSKINSWNQISPSVEVSRSNGVELNQVEKPKFLINFVPVANFDHATALGNSQGFDMSNAVLQNVATVAPIGAFSTTTPLLNTPQPVIAQNFAQLSKNLVNLQNLVSTPIPDIIVGQNTFQNPVQVFLPHPNEQNKNLRGYLPSTMTPVFALTSSLSPALQNIRVQNVQSNNVTPRTTFTITPAPTQLIVPQPTLQTYPNFLQTPLQTTQIHVNPHGLQGQHFLHHGNLQIQNSPTTPTLLPSQTMPESRIVESQNKKNAFSASGTNFVASANLAVGQNEQKQPTNVNSYYLQNPNTQQIVKPQEIVPNILQPGATLNGITINTQQLIPQQNASLNKNLIKNHRLGSITLQAIDNTASHSSNINNVNALEPSSGNAHLPNVGTKNVEIVNPNIKPSQTDTTFQTMNYPTTVLTTPIPIFSTIAPQTVNFPNYVNSLTENKAKQVGTFQNQEPMFNPINFVPNVDIIKDQNALNNKPIHEPIQQGLNLVPVVPGGNFFKPSLAAQSELIVKPKLTSDLQKYAEEMFKESLKTMYNSQKWNNDRKPQENGQNDSEASDLAKLRLEMQKLRASLKESKYKDTLEAHQSMHNVRTTNAPKSSNKKKPDPLLTTLEHLLKTRPHGPIHIYHGLVKPDQKRKPEDSTFDFDNFKDESHIREFLTPPKSKPSHSTSPFHDKPKKRPGSMRFKNNPRRPARPSNLQHKYGGLQSSSSDIHLYVDPDTFNYDSKHQPSFDRYTAFTTASPEIDKMLREFKSNNKNYDINHPRMHNLLGLLMKNKQLPTRSPQNYFRDKDQVREYFENEKHRLQQQFYNDALKDYMNERSDVASPSDSIINKTVYSGIGTA